MANTKLTDAQRVILAAAGARESCLVLPVPKSLSGNGGAHRLILQRLLTRELIIERPMMPGEEVWRETEEQGRTTLVISPQGLEVMGINPMEHVEEDDSGLLADETQGAAGGLATSAAKVDARASNLPKVGT